jgi:hypothetical protein
MSKNYSHFCKILSHIAKELEKEGLEDASYLTALASHSISGAEQPKQVSGDMFFNVNKSNKVLIS